MPVTTSTGEYHETEEDFYRNQVFGPGYNKETDTYENPKFFGIRHGDTEFNEKDPETGLNKVHGWTQQPLNEKGIEQSHKAAEDFKDKDITQIVASDLPRAKQTANIIGKYLDVPVVTNPALRTWDMGDLDGKDTQEAHDMVKKHALESCQE